MNQSPTISVIVPIYNEAPNIGKLYLAIDSVFKKIEHAYELVLVNDGSTDTSEKVLNECSHKNKHVVVLHLARNFGKEVALTAGLHHAKGDAAIMIDADLQHPPKYIPEFIKNNTPYIIDTVGNFLDPEKNPQLAKRAKAIGIDKEFAQDLIKGVAPVVSELIPPLISAAQGLLSDKRNVVNILNQVNSLAMAEGTFSKITGVASLAGSLYNTISTDPRLNKIINTESRADY